MVVAAAALSVTLAACSAHDYNNKRTAGTILGAAGGAVAGAQFGKGDGRLAMTALGTLLGAYIGNEVGASLDRADQLYAQQALQQATTAPINQPVAWSNPQTNHRGVITPTREGRTQDGRVCREFRSTVIIDGQQQEAYGVACRDQTGRWQMM